MKRKRGSGILLHITSLPSRFGIGDFGPEAYRFADFLTDTKQSYWQILPLNLTCTAYGNSPYSSFSAFAGNILLISPEILVREGYLTESDIRTVPDFRRNRVDYKAVTGYKNDLLNRVYEREKRSLSDHSDFQKFCADNNDWLDDYSLFISIKKEHDGIIWSAWPEGLRDRDEKSIEKSRKELREAIEKEKFLQFLFFDQWLTLKDYCDSKGIKIFGDIPIYVNYDSSDVWANPEIFSLDRERKPVSVAGVPPDYFSETGQLWGHPVYNWEELKKSGYAWWIKRIGHNLKLFHMFRLDHFRGFVGYWMVDAAEETAINGRWMPAPGEDFFRVMLEHFPDIDIIAEDLGVITDDVKEVIKKFGFPGMKILLFAFGDDLDSNPYAPHNHIKNCIVYTGTHDNNTIRGWFRNELTESDKRRISDYIGHEVSEETIHEEMIKFAMSSVADMVIIPMQDMLGLGEEDRMNLPSSPTGNWRWRLLPEQLSPGLIKELTEITAKNGRG